MDAIIFPEKIKYILSSLENSGHDAYAVGGCIRDFLLGRTPDDWDVTTSALPEETMELFGESALPTGIKHGTVTVKTADGSVEVTTFRTDGKYTDHRRPDSVRFVTRLEDDLARRDFTVNALAASLSGELIDLFGGLEDMQNHILRCVGCAEERFEEDALRMFRAARFCAKLGFSLEENTRQALCRCAPLAADIASERIETELMKMLPFPCAGQLTLLVESGLMEHFGCRRRALDFSRVNILPEDTMLRCAGMCAVLAVSGTVSDVTAFLSALKCSSVMISSCSAGVDAAITAPPRSRADWKRLLFRLGDSGARCAAAAQTVLGCDDALAELADILGSGECFRLSALAVNGADAAAAGLQGRKIGTALERLLMHVIDKPADNVREVLLKMLRNNS